MRRREFLAGACAALFPSVLAAESGGQLRRVGILMGIANDAEGQLRISTLVEALKGPGWQEGSNIAFEVRWAEGDPARARELAAELVALQPSVLVANSSPATVALRDATSAIPIVFVQVNDPVGQGLVRSLSSPGANITGFLNFEPAIAGKWLELLRELNPAVARVGVVVNRNTAATGSGGAIHLPMLQAEAPKLNISVVPVAAISMEDIERGIADLGSSDTGLIVLPDVFNTVNRTGIAASAAAHRIPAIYPYRYFVADGGLISYGIEISDFYRRAASYVDRILKGEKPEQLPVQGPTKFQMVVNLKAAKALGLEFSPTLLARADEVVE
jgi:putative ABC transport system substrate-binding protein